jgi:hypothetical protein
VNCSQWPVAQQNRWWHWFPLQQWSHNTATLLRYTYTNYAV